MNAASENFLSSLRRVCVGTSRKKTFRWLCICVFVGGGCATAKREASIVQQVPAFQQTSSENLMFGQRPGWEPNGRSITVTTIPAGTPVLSLTYGENAVWVVGQKCCRIDPASNCVVAKFPEAASSLVGVGEGAVWAVKAGFGAENLRRLDLTTGEVLEQIPRIGPGFPYGKSYPVVGEGSVWLHAGKSVVRIDPKTCQVLAKIPTEGTIGWMAFGAGAMWVLEKTNLWLTSEATVSKIDPTNNRLTGIVHLGGGTFCFAVGEGAIWAARVNIAPLLMRIDPDSLRIVRAVPLVDVPTAIAVGAGFVWIGADSAILRVDPRSSQVVEKIPLPRQGYVGGLTVADGSLWAAQGNGIRAGHVYRVDLQQFAINHTPPESDGSTH